MEGDRRQGSSSHDPSLKRRTPDSGLSSSDQLQEESTYSSSFNMSTTPGVPRMEASIMLAGPSSAAGTREILERRIRQRTTPSQENLVSAAPVAPEQRRQHSGGLNTQQGGQQNNSSLRLHGSLWQRGTTRNRCRIFIIPDSALGGDVPQDDDLHIRSRLISEVRNDMGLQSSGATIEYQGHIRVPGHWWLFGVIYQPEDEDDEIRLDIDNMSYEELLALGERIRSVSTGLSEEVIMSKMEQWKYSCSATGLPVGAETCCICQEEYADDDDVGKLDCGHEYHVSCIKEWLAQKNLCPICKNPALAT